MKRELGLEIKEKAALDISNLELYERWHGCCSVDSIVRKNREIKSIVVVLN